MTGPGEQEERARGSRKTRPRGADRLGQGSKMTGPEEEAGTCLGDQGDWARRTWPGAGGTRPGDGKQARSKCTRILIRK